MSLRNRLAGRRDAGDKRNATWDPRRAETDRLAGKVRERLRGQGSALGAAPVKSTPGTFSHLYSSRDDALSVFEDAAGHVVAVGTARLT